MLEKIPIGWRQLDTLVLAINDDATPLTIPDIGDYRKYCLVISPLAQASGVGTVTTNPTELGSAIPLNPLSAIVIGPYDSSELLFLRLAAHQPAARTVYVTPFASVNGELEMHPYNGEEMAILAVLASLLTIVATIDITALTQLMITMATNLQGCCYERRVDVTAPADGSGGTVLLGTGTAQECRLLALVLKSNGPTTGDFTHIEIKAGAAGVLTLIDALDGTWLALAADDNQVGYGEPEGVIIGVGKTIIATLNGTGATPVDFTAYLRYSPIVTGGSIA
jgi:hypothetical protein